MNSFDIKTFISSFFHHNHSRQVSDAFGWWLLNNDHQHETDEEMQKLWMESPSDISSETLEDLNRLHNTVNSRQNHSRHLRILRWAAAVLVLVALSVTATFFGTKGYLYSHYQGNEMMKISTPDGSLREVTLPDSTRVMLAGGSTIICPSAFNGKTRTVFIIGKAHFDVAKDKEHPFIVNTQSMVVTAVGTAFTVDAYSSGDIESTVLEQGATNVSVDNVAQNANTWRMHPGQRLTYDRLSGTVTLSNVETNTDHSWTKGWLVFNGEPFPYIAKELQHRFGVRIMCDNIQHLRGNYYVKFSPSENLNDVLSVLSKLGTRFTYKRIGNTVHIFARD